MGRICENPLCSAELVGTASTNFFSVCLGDGFDLRSILSASLFPGLYCLEMWSVHCLSVAVILVRYRLILTVAENSLGFN